MKDLEMARKHQFEEKEKILADQARQERDEFLDVIQAQKQDEERERRIEEQKRNAFKAHAEQLLDQVRSNNERQK